MDVPKHLLTAPHIYQQIRELAREHTDREIAGRLNQAGYTTVTVQSWTAGCVSNFRHAHAILSAFSTNPALRLVDASHITSTEAARRLGGWSRHSPDSGVGRPGR